MYGISSAVLQRINEYLEKCDIRFVSFVKKTEPVAKIVENVQTGSENNFLMLAEKLNICEIVKKKIAHCYDSHYL